MGNNGYNTNIYQKSLRLVILPVYNQEICERVLLLQLIITITNLYVNPLLLFPFL